MLNVQKVAVGMRIADRPLCKPTHKPYIDQVLASIPPVDLLEQLLNIKRVIAVQLVLIHHKTIPFRGVSNDRLVFFGRMELGCRRGAFEEAVAALPVLALEILHVVAG